MLQKETRLLVIAHFQRRLGEEGTQNPLSKQMKKAWAALRAAHNLASENSLSSILVQYS